MEVTAIEHRYYKLMNSKNIGYYGRILNQIRYEISPLNFHLFTYNINANPICPNCPDSIESTKHFFFECVTYKNSRTKLLNDLNEIQSQIHLQTNTNVNVNPSLRLKTHYLT